MSICSQVSPEQKTEGTKYRQDVTQEFDGRFKIMYEIQYQGVLPSKVAFKEREKKKRRKDAKDKERKGNRDRDRDFRSDLSQKIFYLCRLSHIDACQ